MAGSRGGFCGTRCPVSQVTSGRTTANGNRNVAPVLVSLGVGRDGVASKTGSTRSIASTVCCGTSTRHGGLSGRSRRGRFGRGCQSRGSCGSGPCCCSNAMGRAYGVRVSAPFSGNNCLATSLSAVVCHVSASSRQVFVTVGFQRVVKRGGSPSIVSRAIKVSRGCSTSTQGVGRKVCGSPEGPVGLMASRTTSQSGLSRGGLAVSSAGRGLACNVSGSGEGSVTTSVLQVTC